MFKEPKQLVPRPKFKDANIIPFMPGDMEPREITEHLKDVIRQDVKLDTHEFMENLLIMAMRNPSEFIEKRDLFINDMVDYVSDFASNEVLFSFMTSFFDVQSNPQNPVLLGREYNVHGLNTTLRNRILRSLSRKLTNVIIKEFEQFFKGVDKEIMKKLKEVES